MTVATILAQKGRSVVRVTPMTGIAEVVARLREHRIGAVLVLDPLAPREGARARHVVGIVSERDIVRALADSGTVGEVLDMTASQVMTEVRSTVLLSTSLEAAAQLMTERRVRHLPVLEDEVLVGIVSLGDVVAARLRQQAHEVESLRAYVSGTS